MMMVRSAIPATPTEKDIRLRKNASIDFVAQEPKVMLLSEGGETTHCSFVKNGSGGLFGELKIRTLVFG